MATPCVALCNGPNTHCPSVRNNAICLFFFRSWPNCCSPLGLDYPYVTALLPDQSIQVHDIESQEIAQVLPPPPPPSLNATSPAALLSAERRALAMSSSGFLVPLQQRPEKLVLTKVNLLSRNAEPGGREVVPADDETEVEGYDL